MPLCWEVLIEWLGPASLPSEMGINNRPAPTRTGEGRQTTTSATVAPRYNAAATKIGIRPAAGIPEQTGSRNGCYANQHGYRVVADHRLARLVQLGIQQARHFGLATTKFQLYLAATVANLTLLPDKTA